MSSSFTSSLPRGRTRGFHHSGRFGAECPPPTDGGTFPSRVTAPSSARSWTTRAEAKARRLAAAEGFAEGKVLRPADIVPALEALLSPGDRVVLEGDNQKQADFLSEA